MSWQYRLGSILIRFFFGVFLGFKWRGTENVPEKGGIIIAPNHRSNYDPPLIGSTVKQRAIYYFGKKSLFVNKIFGWFLGRFNVFPADTEKKNDIVLRKTMAASFNSKLVISHWGGVVGH